MKSLAHKEAFLIATFVQAILYGVYIVSFLHCLRWLLFTKEGWKLERKVYWPMLVVPMTLFVLETTDIGLNFARTSVFSTSRSQDLVQTGAAIAALRHSTFSFVDLALIFRCWLLCGQNWRVVYLPLLLWLSCLVCPFLHINCYVPDLSFGQSQQLPSWGILFTPTVVLFSGCHIASNIYATSAIIYRIIQVAAEKQKTCGHMTRRVLTESGLLYTLSSVLSFIVHTGAASRSPFTLFNTTFDPVNFCMAGISVNLIFIGSWQDAEVLKIHLSKASELIRSEDTT